MKAKSEISMPEALLLGLFVAGAILIAYRGLGMVVDIYGPTAQLVIGVILMLLGLAWVLLAVARGLEM